MSQDNRSQVRRVLFLTLGLNLIVMGIKLGVGWQTGALSLIADALHSITDSANNILGLIATHFASPQPDREHPYGHQKFDAIGALGIAAFLGIACFEILSSAVERLLQTEREPVNISASGLWILLVVLGINIFVAFYERHVGQKVGSQILIADAKHTMSDVWVTIVVIAGLIGVWLGYQWLDIALAFPVALLVFWSGWEVLKSNLPWLVDRMAIAPEAIHEIVMQVPGVLNCHSIASRGMVGRQAFIEMHLVVGVPDVETSHKITEEIEARLTQKYHPVRILIHVEPPAYQSDEVTF
ncbi:cation transporter [Desertifilum sp. FACHB-1129]|uniref:Cation transporter n=1 Tax=Desertifilum tharense IPPAS B-1220 TaxID=1781255 RepID=A0A1E5QQZ3_9CYAN|nr:MULTISPECIES: cation diffusion facilitator family transporter [Desertifilum]MDA0212585.1 cation diffusion facilitator family transporter [Cyanobacteria bacterium FC1]MBD2314560.1 cation transporter [Desertifilum sp. FACHB-1129]MBD2321763.1 cation transporter [Desertifilum sp. FACHB-866]MBD2331890.1 cation transporter [Desertifilum sp. FACHB-868]OEJ76753.1 cation transporter [Desertifilum tharense IPPAS B-1220]